MATRNGNKNTEYAEFKFSFYGRQRQAADSRQQTNANPTRNSEKSENSALDLAKWPGS